MLLFYFQNITTIIKQFSIETLVGTVKKGPFLGMDWGKSRVGLAISDSENKVAMPLVVTSPGAPLRNTLVELWKDYSIQALIIGWPCHDDGQKSKLCFNIERLALRLVHDHQWPLAFWDEGHTSFAAASFLGHKKHNKVVDHHAAAVILQGALNRWHHLISLLSVEQESIISKTSP